MKQINGEFASLPVYAELILPTAINEATDTQSISRTYRHEGTSPTSVSTLAIQTTNKENTVQAEYKIR